MSFHTICVACIIVGVGIPFCSIVLGLFDGFADFVSIDLFHIDFGADFIIDFLPLSINSLCLWALLFGAAGLFLDGKINRGLVLVAGLGIGYVSAVILQSLIKRLKRIENFAVDKDEMLLGEGMVDHAIPESGIGSVTLTTSSGSNVTYPAKSVHGEAIEQDKKVHVIEFDGDYLIVESSSYLEEKYDAAK